MCVCVREICAPPTHQCKSTLSRFNFASPPRAPRHTPIITLSVPKRLHTHTHTHTGAQTHTQTHTEKNKRGLEEVALWSHTLKSHPFNPSLPDTPPHGNAEGNEPRRDAGILGLKERVAGQLGHMRGPCSGV